MENSEILKKAILQAVNNGLDLSSFGEKVSKDFDCWFTGMELDCEIGWKDYNFIFHIDFAKAYWGEERTPIDYTNGIPVLNMLADYKWHLQKMIIEKNPVKYIAKFLK